jgi:hypothetical protein
MPKESLLLKLEEADPLTTGNTYKIRAHVVSSGQHPYPMHVYFFDGHPQTGGKLIGSRVLFSLKKGDNYAWSYWTPRDAGKHVLYAMVLEDSNDTNQDAWDSLTVSVRGGGPFPWQLFIPAITGNGQ